MNNELKKKQYDVVSVNFRTLLEHPLWIPKENTGDFLGHDLNYVILPDTIRGGNHTNEMFGFIRRWKLKHK
jgi:hypothetical protein